MTQNSASFKMASNLPHLWLPYCQMKTAPFPPSAEKSVGCTIILKDGRDLIDGIASWWTACHGYCHPHIQKAVIQQVQTMPHMMFGGMIHDQAEILAHRLAKLFPDSLNHVFFSDSGSTAIEVAVKMAFQYFLNQEKPARHKLLSFHGGYHGDTWGMMNICDPEEGMHNHFREILNPQYLAHLPTDPQKKADLERFLKHKGSEIAAMIVEPLVQGAGGMLFHTRETLKILRDLCDEHDILLIYDEVFTGFGRLGEMFVSNLPEICPDIVGLSKALTGGTMGLGATIASQKIFESFLSENAEKALMHGPTFMGNPLACAAANASLDLFETEPRLEQVQKIEKQLTKELEPFRKLPHVKDIRIMGALGVVEMDHIPNPAALNQAFLKLGVWIRPFRNILYLTPSFTITSAELTKLTHAIGHVIEHEFT
ncbi:adenosylmethionine--8-amino-7-oxononanoate transaminase [Acetobacteraceae bacterium]|nr:adenosylmethionine--8-amino-7-oxononanoate transaminase [Acetobacteraceae bacterium]